MNITGHRLSVDVLQPKLSTNMMSVHFLLYHHHLLLLPAELQAPSQSEEVDKLHDAEETEPRAQPHQAPKCRYEVLNGVDDVLAVLDQAVLLEVDVQQGQV